MDNKNPRIEEIFDRVAAGDRDALQAFIAFYQTRLCRRIAGKLRAGGVYADADLVEELHLSASRRADEALALARIRAGDADALRAYLAALADNRACEEVRRARRERSVRAALALMQRPSGQAAADNEQIQLAQEILEHLKQGDRELMELVVRGMAVELIAQHLGISAAAARKRLMRLKALLRSALVAKATKRRNGCSGVRNELTHDLTCGPQ